MPESVTSQAPAVRFANTTDAVPPSLDTCFSVAGIVRANPSAGQRSRRGGRQATCAARSRSPWRSARPLPPCAGIFQIVGVPDSFEL